ncbi:MAG: fused MFS/spermidine synthase [Acidobacteria bacterium]|nr:fused MFS/spermidine synthase [Acidobacteriota bacterium]
MGRRNRTDERARSAHGESVGSRLPRTVALVCFLLSGASGLVFQVVWMRELTLIFGATTLAVSTVLAVFMGGLALGGLAGGRLADRNRRPLRLYAWLEIAIGLYGLAIPSIFDALPLVYQPLWRAAGLSFLALSLVRFALAGATLAIPTVLMGATLPLLSRVVARHDGAVGRDVGRLYTVNTVGAVIGASSAGLFLVPAIGMTGTTLTAAILNLIAGAVALAFDRGVSAAAPAERPVAEATIASPLSRPESIALFAAFGASGVAALVYEVAWSRALALVLGSSVYAFSIMLTTFLIGLALGAGAGAWRSVRVRRPLLALSIVECGVGLAAFAGLFLVQELPYVFLVLHRRFEGSPAALLLGTRLAVAALVMLVPTTLLGAVFPLAVRAASGSLASVGRTVGALYSINTLGAIVGAFAAGFIVIPWLGVEGGIVAGIVLNFGAAAALAMTAGGIGRPYRAALASALLAAAILTPPLRPHWEPAVMASGVYRYAPSIAATSRAEFLSHYLGGADGETVYYRDGVSATVAVQRQSGHFVLKVNGKPDATTAGDLPTQALVAHLPLLVRPEAKTALVVGWGSGVSVGAALAHPIERVTAVELEPAVVEASAFFEGVNGRPLEDPRTELLINDGRNLLAATDRRFDVIVSEPSNPWLTGVANLFTREYFEAGARSLSPGGVFCQWLQIYEMQPAEVATLLATFESALPNVYVFRGATGDLLLLGSLEPFELDVDRIRGLIDTPGPVHDRMADVRIRSVESLLSRLYLTPDGVRKLSASAPLNTDDNARIEFLAPLRVGIGKDSTEEDNLAALDRNATPLAGYAPGCTPEMLCEMALSAISRGETRRGWRFVEESLQARDSARGRSILGELLAASGRDEEALAEWQRAIALSPDDLATNLNLGKYFLEKGNVDGAVEHLRRAAAAQPGNARARHLYGLALQFSGDVRGGVAELEAAGRDAAYVAANPVFQLHIGRALRDAGRYADAEGPLRRYVDLVPDDPLGFLEAGLLDLILGDQSGDGAAFERAERAFLRALTIDPGFAEAHRNLALVYRKLERYEDAAEEMAIYERLRSS